MKRTKLAKKIMALLLCAAMLLAMLPTYAFAAEEEESAEAVSTETTEVSDTAEAESGEEAAEETPSTEETEPVSEEATEETTEEVAAPATDETTEDEGSETLTRPGDVLAAGPKTGATTTEQPYVTGTNGSSWFRIPSLVTLSNGWLAVAADARYTTVYDGGGLDSMVSISKDGGETWESQMTLYFPDSDGYGGTSATTIIDPILTVGADGTLYLMADVNPTGVTTYTSAGFTWPGAGTGYITLSDGTKHLALTDTYSSTSTSPTADTTTYAYYVGDFAKKDGRVMAPVLNRADGTNTQYWVDEWYNLYILESDGSFSVPTQTQVNSSTVIQQNVFYKDSALHVYKTGYMWLAYSTDNGATWHNQDLNPQIKGDTETALLVAPGHGTTTSDGTIIIPFYSTGASTSAYYSCSSFIYSKDNGKTWTRSDDVPPGAGFSGSYANYMTGECEAVELADGTIRLFVRTASTMGMSYIDATWDADQGKYVWESVTDNGSKTFHTLTDGALAKLSSNCKITAVVYPELINGQQAIIFAGASSGSSTRNTGIIYVMLLDEDNKMTLYNTYDVTASGDYFAYSCLSVLDDGSIGLLWEDSWTSSRATIVYSNYQIEDLLPDDAVVGTDPAVKASIEEDALLVGETTTATAKVWNAEGAEVTWTSSDESIATVDAKGVVTGVAEGKAELTASITVDEVQYSATVTVGVYTADTLPLPDDLIGEVADPVELAESEFKLDTNGVDDGTYVISHISTKRVLYNVANSAKSDQVQYGSLKDDVITTTSSFAVSRQTWIIEEVEGGYTIQGVDSGTYINLNATTNTSSRVPLSSTPQVLNIEHTGNGNYIISGTVDGTTYYLYHTNSAANQFYVSTTYVELQLYTKIPGTYTVDDSGLQELLQQANALLPDEARYTTDSWSAFITAMTAGQAVTVNADGYETEEEANTVQEQVNEAARALYAAIRALKEHDHPYTSEVTLEPTCTEDGVRTYTCPLCNDVYTEVIPATGEHTYKSEVTTAPTCGATGVKTYTCEVCGDVYTEVIPATGEHTYKGEVTTAPTCVATGIMTYTCEVCGDIYTEEIPATGEHTYKGEVTTEPTCGATGVLTYTCEVCGDTYTEEIPATGEHSYNGVVTTEPTCTETGVKTYTCEVCGDTYTEEIPATGHTVVVDEAQDPTSTETGLTEGKHCSVCQTVLVAQEVIPAVEEPATPSEQPTTPSTSTTVVVSSTTQEKTSPQTGDNAKIGYALGLLLLSGTALAAGLVLSARRKKR